MAQHNKDELRAIVEAAIACRVFSGTVLWLARGDKCFAHEAFGTSAYEAEYSRAVTTDTIYDLASIAKLFTTTAFLIVADEFAMDACTPLAKFLPEFATIDKDSIELRHLLLHNSGIEIAIQDLIDVSPELWIQRIAGAPLHSPVGEKVLYSCTNFFLLARVIELISGAHLDELIQERIIAPLGMTRTSFYPQKIAPLDEIAPTEIICGQQIHGVVHDEAARTWQEYSGHASGGNSGLFGTAADLAKFCALWMNNGIHDGKKVLSPELIRAALSDTFRETNTSALRAWGWHVDAQSYMSERAPKGSIGHAGFTGPTLWLNRETQHVCIIVNNRVCPTREGPERFPTHRKIARWLLDAVSI
jgi:CubicO group peptidase (beta-lactamase class C family)